MEKRNDQEIDRACRLITRLRSLAAGTTFPAERESALAKAAQIEREYGIVHSAGSGSETNRKKQASITPEPFLYTIIVHDMSLKFLDEAVGCLTSIMARFQMPCTVSWKAEYAVGGFFFKTKTASFEAVFSSPLESAVVAAANLFIHESGLQRS